MNRDRMNRGKLLLLGAVLAVITAVCVQRYKTSRATPLFACQKVPVNLSEELRGRYSRICSTDVEERHQGLLQLPPLSPSEVVILVPLLAEVMTTDDYIQHDRRRFYVAELAGEDIAIIAGVDGVPVLIRSFQSQKPVEIHAALSGVRRLLNVLGWGPKANTNEMRAASISLLPYVHMLTTNSVPETDDMKRAFFGHIAYRAQRLEGELKRFLPPTASKQ